MTRDCDALPGRDDELAALEKAAGRPVLVVVGGPAGAGKTALLDAVRRKWRDRGLKTIHICFSAGGSDEFGIRAALAAVCEEFGTRHHACPPGDPGCSPSGPALFTELARLFEAARPAAVFFDDLDAVPNAGFTVAAARYAGCTVVAACREAVEPTLLSALADEVVDLRPLTDGEADELLAVDGPVDPAVAPAVRAALGPLRGNPGAVLAIRDGLRRDGRLVPVRGVWCLAGPAAPLALPPDHDLVREVTGLPEPAPELVAFAGGGGRFRMDDLLALAEAAGWDPAACGRAADRLVETGVLGYEEHGELVVPCPALAAAVRTHVGERRICVLHAKLAEYLLGGVGEPAVAAPIGPERPMFAAGEPVAGVEDGGLGPGAVAGRGAGYPRGAGELAAGVGDGGLGDAGVRPGPDVVAGRGSGYLRGAWEPALVAEQVALAGSELRSGPGVVPLLVREAARVLSADPASAARWYRAALVHCATHDPGRVPELTRSLLRLLVRLGRYDWLREVVAETVDGGVPTGQEHELAVAAALAALHTGVPVPRAVTERLAAEPACRAPLEFAGRWFEGRDVMSFDGLVAAFGGFRLGDAPDAAPMRDQLEIWTGRHDLVALFGFLFGDEYGAPDDGPLALYHRVITGYHRGTWVEVLSACRALELSGRPSTPGHGLARLFAAEILSGAGEARLAADWLAAVGDCPFPALATWAECGLLWRSGRLPEAIETGWRGYAAAAEAADRGNVIGLHWLLVRLAMLESQACHDEKVAELRTLAGRWYRRYGGRRLKMADLMVAGLAERDLASARSAVEAVRNHENQGELMLACLIAASVADEPRPWLHEAYDIARRLGGDLLRMTIKARMRELGVPPPRRPGASDDLSPAELRVIGLIQQGLTNRQIAGTLQISEKTVESHLTRLFAKTGCRSRLDLATASIEGRLTVSGTDRSGTA
ncbi:helix-turn-helix transcriptional regulator [Amycolatopsis sp. lyj-346]|uniref:helix-turn-helix transcriptional regulator n=1 Tax=Amycolatopsis sp. lyj-346 TaxID=2789289 RepID=UPI003979BA17